MNERGLPRIIVTCGEPAGIGPELLVRLAQRDLPLQLVCSADPSLLDDTASALGAELELTELSRFEDLTPHRPGHLYVYPVELQAPCVPGSLDGANAGYVLRCLDLAIDACLRGDADAMTTAPLHKAILNQAAGNRFTGHTEYLAARAAPATTPIMMLVSGGLRVALVTTHIRLADVPAAISRASVAHAIKTTADALGKWFDIGHPRIAVCGLNPHAGESGHFGDEEIREIEPAVAHSKRQGIDATGPLPADTAFVAENRERYDAFIAMYHDQGLPVIKALGFGATVNITLGLPLIRTSVDHGTALDIAGRGQADASSLIAAVELASRLAA